MEKIGHFIILKLKDLYAYEKISKLILLAKLQYRRFLYLSKNQEFSIDSKGTKRILENITKKNISQLTHNKTNKKLIENQSTRIRKVNDKDINHYLYSRNLKLNRDHSVTLKKIIPIDHYNWWFTTKRISHVLIKNNKRLLYLYDDKIFSDKTYDYFVPGWFACHSNCTISEILYALKWQYQKNMKLNVVNSKQKIIWLATVKNNNKFIMKLNKYIGFKRLSEKNSCTKILKKYYNINKG